jgi:uncharacterized membrane protein YccC
VENVLRPEPAVKGARWPSRLLDGLGGLGGWLVGPDPGLNRLRIVLCAMATIAGAIGAEWLFVHFTGALLRPAPPAADGAAAAVRVVAANHALLIFAMVLGGVIGLTAAISVQDTRPRDQVVSMLVLPVPMIAVLALSLAIAHHRVLALCLLPLILAAGTYPRRFGPAGVRVGPLLFTGYLFGFLLGSVITLGDIGWLTAEIGVGIVVAIAVKVGVFHDTSSRALRRTQRSYAARARRLAGLALAAFDEPGPRASRRLYRHKTRLGEATQLIDGQLADPGLARPDSAAALLHQGLFDSWLALGNLARFAAALGRSPLYAGQREQVREILASLRDGRLDDARASALAFAETLTAPTDPDGDNTEIIAHRFAGSVTDFADALSQWLELGAQDQPAGAEALFAPAVPLRQGGSLSVTAAATAEASSTAEPGRHLRLVAVAPYVRTAIQVGVAVGAAIALGDLLSGQRFYWAAIGAFVVFQGTSNTEEQISKALSRIVGTLVGIVAGDRLVSLIGPHGAAWMIVIILASVLLGLYLQRADYAFLVIGITVMVSQLYTELGDFSTALLVQRLEETAIGAAVAAAVVLVVLPLHASRVARVALQGYLAAMASLLRHTYAAFGGEQDADAALQQDDTRALNTAYQSLASSIQSMRRVQAGGQSERAGATIVAATSARRYALNLVRDIPPAAVPDADTAALLNRGGQTLQASLTSLQSALAGPGGYTYTRSASLFDVIEQRLTAPGGGSGDGRLALRDLRLIDGALAELASALGLHVVSYDIVPADDHVRSAGAPNPAGEPAAPDPAGEPASSQSAAADGGEPDR